MCARVGPVAEQKNPKELAEHAVESKRVLQTSEVVFRLLSLVFPEFVGVLLASESLAGGVDDSHIAGAGFAVPDRVEVALSGLALGLGQPGARHLYTGQVRWRFCHELYALAEGGTLLFPEADGALGPGAFASLGLGVDNAR